MSLSACLICRHARKPKGSGLGRVVCSISGESVECMHVCNGFDSLFSAVEKAQAVEGGFQSGFPCNTRTNCTTVQSHG